MYPLTVEVLGTGPQGYDEQPDGVALTLLPLMRPGADPASLSIVVPFRAAVARGPDGSLEEPEPLGLRGWLRAADSTTCSASRSSPASR